MQARRTGRKGAIKRRGPRRINEATAARMARGLTLEQVARLVNLTPATVRLYELEGIDCERTARRMALAVGCDQAAYLPGRARRDNKTTSTTSTGRETPKT